MTVRHRWMSTLIAACMVAAGCAGKAPTQTSHKASEVASTGPGASSLTRTVVQSGQALTLTGKVKLLSDNGAGLVSDNGAGIISNHSGSLIANNGGGVVANNAGNVISNNAGGLTGKTKRQLLDTAPGVAEFALADAVINLYDATGAQLVDEKGKPLTATTDGTGAYTFKGVLPSGNLVMRVTLVNGGRLKGGELSAMLPHPASAGAIQPITTSTSLGAAYVLGKYVKGDQKTYDKLPAAEAGNLAADLDGARTLITAPPSYQPDALVDLAENLRGQAPAVGRELDAIKSLLLGQAQLGNGQLATQVPLVNPSSVALDASGRLLVGEMVIGRVRRVEADGTMTTFADAGFGLVKHNYPRLKQLAQSPDGSLVLLTETQLSRAGTDHQNHPIAAIGGADADVGSQPTLNGFCVAVGLDDTIYVGEGAEAGGNAMSSPARLTSISPAGQVTRRKLDAIGNGIVVGVATAPDGTLDLLVRTGTDDDDAQGTLYRFHPDTGAAEKRVGGFSVSNTAPIAHAPDGTVYLSSEDGRQLLAIAPDNTMTPLAGDGAAGEAASFQRTGQIVAAADGTLYVPDLLAGVVRTRKPDGTWDVAAGTTGAVQTSQGPAVVTNAPGGAAFDGLGRLVVADAGSYQVKRYDGRTYTAIAGSIRGNHGIPGPALAAQLGTLTGVLALGDSVYLVDCSNSNVSKLDANGQLTPVLSRQPGPATPLAPGSVGDPLRTLTGSLMGIAQGPDGSLYLSDSTNHQILRVSPDGTSLTVVAGVGSSDNLGALDVPTGSVPARGFDLALVAGLAFDAAGNLYAADTGAAAIWKITDPAGDNPQLSRFAGTGLTDLLSHAGDVDPAPQLDVAAADALLIMPVAVAFDAAGNLYESELGSVNLGRLPVPGINTEALGAVPLPQVFACVRKIDPSGRATIVAGEHGRFFTDPHAEDALQMPSGLAIAPDGRMAIMDTGANLIHILPAGSY